MENEKNQSSNKIRKYKAEFFVQIEKEYPNGRISLDQWGKYLREIFGTHLPNIQNFRIRISKWKVMEETETPVDKWLTK